MRDEDGVAVQFRIGLLGVSELLAAFAAPGGEVLDEHGAADEIRECERLAVDVDDFESLPVKPVCGRGTGAMSRWTLWRFQHCPVGCGTVALRYFWDANGATLQ